MLDKWDMTIDEFEKNSPDLGIRYDEPLIINKESDVIYNRTGFNDYLKSGQVDFGDIYITDNDADFIKTVKSDNFKHDFGDVFEVVEGGLKELAERYMFNVPTNGQPFSITNGFAYNLLGQNETDFDDNNPYWADDFPLGFYDCFYCAINPSIGNRFDVVIVPDYCNPESELLTKTDKVKFDVKTFVEHLLESKTMEDVIDYIEFDIGQSEFDLALTDKGLNHKILSRKEDTKNGEKYFVYEYEIENDVYEVWVDDSGYIRNAYFKYSYNPNSINRRINMKPIQSHSVIYKENEMPPEMRNKIYYEIYFYNENGNKVLGGSDRYKSNVGMNFANAKRRAKKLMADNDCNTAEILDRNGNGVVIKSEMSWKNWNDKAYLIYRTLANNEWEETPFYGTNNPFEADHYKKNGYKVEKNMEVINRTFNSINRRNNMKTIKSEFSVNQFDSFQDFLWYAEQHYLPLLDKVSHDDYELTMDDKRLFGFLYDDMKSMIDSYDGTEIESACHGKKKKARKIKSSVDGKFSYLDENVQKAIAEVENYLGVEAEPEDYYAYFNLHDRDLSDEENWDIERICGRYEAEYVPLDTVRGEDKGFVIMSEEDWNKD